VDEEEDEENRGRHEVGLFTRREHGITSSLSAMTAESMASAAIGVKRLVWLCSCIRSLRPREDDDDKVEMGDLRFFFES
jgi:hypothetical protein